VLLLAAATASITMLWAASTATAAPGSSNRQDSAQSPPPTPRRVHGVVLGLDEAGAKYGSLWVTATNSGGGLSVMIDQVQYSHEGIFQTALLDPGTYELSTSPASLLGGPHRGTATVTISGEVEPPFVRIQLHPTNVIRAEGIQVAINGLLVDGVTGLPITNFSIQHGRNWTSNGIRFVNFPHENDSQITSYWGTSDAETNWSLRFLAPGYLPEILTGGSARSAQPVTNVIVRMKPRGSMSGTILDSEGRPAAQMQVFLVAPAGLTLGNGKVRFDMAGYGSLANLRGLGLTADSSFDSAFQDSSATTDATGRFTLSNVDETAQRVIAASADGHLFWAASQTRPGEALNITLPQPGSLRMRYDIPGEPPEAQLYLLYLGPREALPSWKDMMTAADVLQFPLRTLRLPPWTNVQSLLSLTLTNGGETNLTNLASGCYLALRWKVFPMTSGEDVEREPFLIGPGQTARWEITAAGRQHIRGTVAGLAEIKAKGGDILVRSADATGQPWKRSSGFPLKPLSPDDAAELARPTFDKLTFGRDGRFETAMLKPGTYTVIAQVHPPVEQNFDRPEPAWIRFIDNLLGAGKGKQTHSGAGLGGASPFKSTVSPPGDTTNWWGAPRTPGPDYIGVAHVTIAPGAAPAPVTIRLAQAKYADIIGQAVDDKTDELIPDVFIQAGTANPEKPGQITWLPAYDEAGGKFALEGLEEGHVMRFMANGCLPQVLTRREVVASRQTANWVVRMKRGREYAGTVVDHSGKPAIQLEVIFAPSEQAGMPGPPSRYFGYSWTTTDATGHFSLRGMDVPRPRFIVKTADDQRILGEAHTEPGRDLKIVLPEPTP
jgi:hypothetical protein